MRRHSRTQRLPLECFEAEEQPHLLPPPTTLYEIPEWCDPKVGRDHLAQVGKALYSLPTRFIGKKLRARADRTLVCFYDQGILVKTHPRKPPGDRSTDPNDFPAEKSAYAMRDICFLERQASQHGAAIGRLAHHVLEGPLPWTRMRRVYALLGLVRRYGETRVEQTCRLALDAEMYDVRRLERMLQTAATSAPITPPSSKPAPARHLRPASQYSLPFNTRDH
jgi:hypothetical protein